MTTEPPPLIGLDGFRVPCQFAGCDRRAASGSRCELHVESDNEDDEGCRCGNRWDEHSANDTIGPTKHWPANVPTPLPPPPTALTERRKREREMYYRAKLRSLLADRLSGPPGVECHYCQGQPGEWCEYDCGSPFPVLHSEYRDKTPLDRVRALALSEQRNGGLVDPADILTALDERARDINDDERMALARAVLDLARDCPDHPMLPKPSCPECARSGGITAAAHLVARGIE